MTLIKEVKLIDTLNGKRIAYTPVIGDNAYKAMVMVNSNPVDKNEIAVNSILADKNIAEFISITVYEDETIQLKTQNGGYLTIQATYEEIIADRTNAVLDIFHECMKQQEYLVFTAPRSFNGECDLMIFEDDGYYEIFADKGTILFSVMTY